jgi:glycosyltransferase involved in cell wall biosynthesis
VKIAWATPFNLRSAIGRVSADVTRELAGRGHEVVVIVADEEPLEAGLMHPTRLQTLHWSKILYPVDVQPYDIVIVNVGDHYGYHKGVFRLLELAACIGIFHDFYIYNLFAGWLAASGAGPAVHDAEIASTYGSDTLELARRIRSGGAGLDEMAARTPMTEWIARRCVGALAHANFYTGRLRAACPGPIAVAPLPVTPRGVGPTAPRAGGTLTVVTVGNMNRNKCADVVIEAIASSRRLRSGVEYHLVGAIEPAEAARLRDLAAARRFGGLRMFGAVDDAALNAHLDSADIICCLRKPVLEGASGSAIEGLLTGRPVIVADTGFYADLPDDMVFKVPAEVDRASVARQLERLVDDAALRRSAGLKAKAWAEAQFSVTGYANVLEELFQEVLDAAPVLQLGGAVGQVLRGFGLSADDPAIDRIAGVLGRMLPLTPRAGEIFVNSQ